MPIHDTGVELELVELELELWELAVVAWEAWELELVELELEPCEVAPMEALELEVALLLVLTELLVEASSAASAPMAMGQLLLVGSGSMEPSLGAERRPGIIRTVKQKLQVVLLQNGIILVGKMIPHPA